MSPEADLTAESLDAFIRTRYPDREPGDANAVDELARELISTGCRSISDVAVMLDRTFAALDDRERSNPPSGVVGAMFNAVGAVRISLDADTDAVYYVDVCDSTDPPEIFAREEMARRWAKEYHTDWLVESEMVRQRFEAGVSYRGAVEEAQTGGWYRSGPVPAPLSQHTPESEHLWVYVVHSGLTTFVFADKSDAEAIHHVWSLSPEHGSRHHLHAVRVRP